MIQTNKSPNNNNKTNTTIKKKEREKRNGKVAQRKIKINLDSKIQAKIQNPGKILSAKLSANGCMHSAFVQIMFESSNLRRSHYFTILHETTMIKGGVTILLVYAVVVYRNWM
jgi:hypothetical protein